MPTSDTHAITDVLHVIELINPTSILDIGLGFGRWGVLCRELLDVNQRGKLKQEEWECRIDGYEICADYRYPGWSVYYDEITVGDARQLIKKAGHYDLIIAGDVIEHLEKSEGMELLEDMLSHGKYVIVTSPRGFRPQGPVYGNPHEVHKSGWSGDDFKKYPHLYKDVWITFVAVLSRDADSLRGIQFFSSLGSQTMPRVLRTVANELAGRIRRKLAAHHA